MKFRVSGARGLSFQGSGIRSQMSVVGFRVEDLGF